MKKYPIVRAGILSWPRDYSEKETADIQIRQQRTCITFLDQYIASKSHVNLLPDDKILHWSKLKQIADDILNYF